MKVLTVNFPSVLETTFGNTENSAKDLLNGLKIKKEDTWYMVGNLAKRAGVNPNHVTNASPQLEDYEVLFKSALVTVAAQVEQPVAITMGFPFSTYSVYKTNAEQFLSKRHFMAEYDTQTYNVNGSVKRTTFDVDNFDVIPEIVGCIIGLKKILGNKPPTNFIAISLGFGTIEGGMATENGLVHRTCFSSYGLQYAIDNLHQELSKRYYLVRGKVKAFKIHEDGKEYITDIFSDGDFIGYHALINDSNYADSTMILEEAEIMQIPREDFLQMIYKDIQVAAKFIHIITQNIKEKEERLISLAYSSLRKRVAKALVDIHSKYNSNGGSNPIEISRDDIAHYIGTATESLIRTLSDFKAEKLIQIKESKIIITDIGKLQNLLY